MDVIVPSLAGSFAEMLAQLANGSDIKALSVIAVTFEL
jgi:hypothetical protein